MSQSKPLTEQPSLYRNLEKMTVNEVLNNMNAEDKLVAEAVEKTIPAIENLVTAISDKMLAGGRLFYIGAGTSGRLAVVDASECQPTFGIPPGLVIAIIAGGEKAFTTAVEFAEDSRDEGWKELEKNFVCDKDVVIGIAASGNTPFVVGALEACKKKGIVTGGITCNKDAAMANFADHLIEVLVGPEFITGSTRMKCGTAQKLVLNMISTTVMIQLGRVEDNIMVNMQLSNAKLIDRGVKMVMDKLNLDYKLAKEQLLKAGSVKAALFNKS